MGTAHNSKIITVKMLQPNQDYYEFLLSHELSVKPHQSASALTPDLRLYNSRFWSVGVAIA